MISQERLKIKVKLLLSANRKSRRVTGTTTSDLEWQWPFHASRAISAVAKLRVSFAVHCADWFNRQIGAILEWLHD